MRKNWFLAAAGVAVAAGAVAAMHGQRPAQDAQADLPPAIPVEVATAELREVADLYAADAVIEAIRTATVSAQIAGNVTRYHVDAGDRVKRGQLLLRIDTRATDAQVAAGDAGVAQAEAQLAEMKLDYARTAKLLESRFVSQAALDRADANLKSAQAAVQTARAGAMQATTARSFAEVRSPVDGIVTRRLAELGEFASPGKPLLEIHDPAALRAVAAVPQFVLPRVAQARRAEVIVPSLGARLQATRVVVMPAADARLLSTQLRADLPANVPAGVIPGAAAKVLLPTGTVQQLVIPASAVVRRGELTATYVVGNDGHPRLRQIRVGETSGAWVEVLAGVDSGERVQVASTAAAR